MGQMSRKRGGGQEKGGRGGLAGSGMPGDSRSAEPGSIIYWTEPTGDKILVLVSFCPEKAIFRNFFVNLRAYSCGELMFASAQALDFLDLTENISFPNQKL
jgi:hypothetical protein